MTFESVLLEQIDDRNLTEEVILDNKNFNFNIVVSLWRVISS